MSLDVSSKSCESFCFFVVGKKPLLVSSEFAPSFPLLKSLKRRKLVFSCGIILPGRLALPSRVCDVFLLLLPIRFDPVCTVSLISLRRQHLACARPPEKKRSYFSYSSAFALNLHTSRQRACGEVTVLSAGALTVRSSANASALGGRLPLHPPRAVRSSASGPRFDAPIADACVERRLSSRTFLARSLYPSRMHSASASRPSKCPFVFPIFTSSLLLWCPIMLRVLFFAFLLIVLAFRTVRRNCGFQSPPPRRAPILGYLFPSCLYVYPSCIDSFFSA